jgi:hypothetical protein
MLLACLEPVAQSESHLSDISYTVFTSPADRYGLQEDTYTSNPISTEPQEIHSLSTLRET